MGLKLVNCIASASHFANGELGPGGCGGAIASLFVVNAAELLVKLAVLAGALFQALQVVFRDPSYADVDQVGMSLLAA